MTGTDRYCVMGHPVGHSRSPWIHARFAALTGQTLDYGAQLVALDGFAAALRDFANAGGRGCNITVPFKHEAARLADTRSERVAQAGAANTLVLAHGRIHADNTDGLGLVADIEQGAGVPLAGRDVLLIGAGGAAAGVLAPLLARAPRRLAVCNRTQARAEALVERHLALATLTKTELMALDQKAPETDFDVIINATSSSLSGGGVPVPASVLRPGSLACDLMYGAPAQGFLDWATRHGAHARDGLGMLVQQAAESFLLWRGVRPPAEQVLAELRALLAPA
ncbi:MAG: shikimate dehydrogenase [Burkholderiales bacterium 66-5]|nr:MAG: shikimate dehydrogenase [Burkholderiales bacterium 66-5]